MGEPFAKDAARKMRKELADLEAEQAKATCWGAAVGERGKRIDVLRRELARQPDTSAEAVERLIAPIRDHLEQAEKENARLQYIKATIRVNAMRNGATEDEILKMQTGGMSFIEWMSETLDYSALVAERDALRDAQGYTYIGKNGKPVLARDLEDQRDALQAKLDEAVGALDAIATYRKQCHEYDADCGHALRNFDGEDVRLMERQARATIAKLKGTDDE